MPKAVTKYQAMDGSHHESEALAKTHEARLHAKAIVGLTEQEVTDMLAGKPSPKAASVEFVGSRVARARVEAGGSKRRKAQA